MEQFITIIVLIAGAALSAWVKKKEEDPDKPSAPTAAPASPVGPGRPTADSQGQFSKDLAGLIRHLMDPNREYPAVPPTLPPIEEPPFRSRPREHPATPATPPVIRTTTTIVLPPKPQTAPQKVDQGIKPPEKSKKISTSIDAGARMKETAHAFMHSGHSPRHVQAEIQAIANRCANPITNAPLGLQTNTNAEAARVRTLLRQPKTFREMMLGSVVLGEPKGLR